MADADAFGAALAAAEDADLWSGDAELLVDGAGWRWRDLHEPDRQTFGPVPLKNWSG